MRSTFLAVILLLCLSSVSKAATHDTSFKFSTIETANFSIHFHQGLEPLAQKTAAIAEEVHARLSKEFLWQPSEKTQVVLIDDSDFANGLTVNAPYNNIYLHVVPPSLASTLGEYDDWLKVLFTHEYTHVLTSDPARGYSKVTRAIFGKPVPYDLVSLLYFLLTAPPNTFMPRWWHEGNATWSESEYTGQGRGKGSYFDMVFRTAVAENNLPYVDQINGDVPYWPDGNLAYMYGYRLHKYIADTYGKESIGKLSSILSGRFPYFFDGAPEQLFGGKSYRALYADMITALKKEQSQRIEILSKVPFTPLRTISTKGESLSNPRFSPDGKRIAYTRVDPNDHTMTVITDSTGNTVLAEFRRHFSDESNSWSPDGARLYFTQGEVKQGFDIYQDLYAYDVSRDKITRLTHGKRVSSAEISPDGKLFAAVVSSRGSQHLALIDAHEPDKSGSTRIVTDYLLQRISSPHWSPDGTTLCYALTDNAGDTSIRTYELATGKDLPLFSASHTAAYPVWSRDGSCIFYISDETGVFNLFAYDLKERKSYQVSHLLGGALQPDTSPDGGSVLLSSYNSHGFSIAQLTLDRTKWSEKRGPSLPLTRFVAAPVSTNNGASHKGAASVGVAPTAVVEKGSVSSGAAGESAPGNSAVAREAETTGGAAALPSAPYNAFNTLYPRFWLPRFTDDGSNSLVVGAYTAGADVVGYNSFTLSADYSAGRNRGYYDFFYQNDYFYPTLSLKAHASPFLYSNLLQRADYWELNQGFSVEASVPVNFLESHYTVNGGYELRDQKALSNFGSVNGIRPFQGRSDNLFAGISFDNVLKYPYSISSEDGRNISFLYKRLDRAIGSDLNQSQYIAEYREYLSMPTQALKHHVLFLRLSGAVSDGDNNLAQQAFQIGGVPSDLNPFPLRGYTDRSAVGRSVATGTVEYRAPLFYPMRGLGTLPAFLEKVHGALFIDAGKVWNDRLAFGDDQVKIGGGAELRTDLTLGYWAKVTPALGIAHGFDRGGTNQIYLTLYLNL
jgi:Tol biopolymer transport system component